MCIAHALPISQVGERLNSRNILSISDLPRHWPLHWWLFFFKMKARIIVSGYAPCVSTLVPLLCCNLNNQTTRKEKQTFNFTPHYHAKLLEQTKHFTQQSHFLIGRFGPFHRYRHNCSPRFRWGLCQYLLGGLLLGHRISAFLKLVCQYQCRIDVL